MDHIDHFSSMFKRAEKTPFSYLAPSLERIVLISDGDAAAASQLQKQITQFLPILESEQPWKIVTGDQFETVDQLISIIEEHSPDLVITKRYLHEKGMVPQHSLGVFVDVLTQVLKSPVLLLPEAKQGETSIPHRESRNVMIVTDHVAGQSQLVSLGATFGAGQGDIWICHVEDDAVWERYIRAIERIPEIDSGQARTLIQRQLFHEASEFIESAISTLKTVFPDQMFHTSVSKGHLLKQYLHLIESHDVELLVFNTKDEDQLAMHGMAYALSVEVVQIPLLLL